MCQTSSCTNQIPVAGFVVPRAQVNAAGTTLDSMPKNGGPRCVSQPCGLVQSGGPTKILPFVYLGSQQDAMNAEFLKVRMQPVFWFYSKRGYFKSIWNLVEQSILVLILQKSGINYVLNLSALCPKLDSVRDENFLRIPVNDTNTEKLLPHFDKALEFLGKLKIYFFSWFSGEQFRNFFKTKFVGVRE